MHDTVALEKLGLPSALIVTTEFVHEAKMQSAALGLPMIDTAVIDHPLSTLSRGEIQDRAIQVANQVKSIWVTGHAAETKASRSPSNG